METVMQFMLVVIVSSVYGYISKHNFQKTIKE